MPIRRHRRARKSKPRRRVAKKLSLHRTIAPANTACITELVEYTDITANTTLGLNFSLFEFTRASIIAANFKFYRATHVEWLIDPLYNVFGEAETTGATSTSVPYIYHRMNRNQDSVGYTIANLQAMGAKPYKFTKQMRYAYRPNWCSPGMQSFTINTAVEPPNQPVTSVVSQGRKVEYGWLATPNRQPSTNTGSRANMQFNPLHGNVPPAVPGTAYYMAGDLPNAVLFNGSDIFIDQLNSNGSTILARITAKVTWEFKEPNFAEQQSPLNENGSAPVVAEPAPPT